MKNTDTVILENFFRNLFYSVIEQFIPHAIPEIENELTRSSRDILLKKSKPIVEKAVKKAVKELKKHNITTMESLSENPDLITRLMGNIQNGMEKDAEKLSKK